MSLPCPLPPTITHTHFPHFPPHQLLGCDDILQEFLAKEKVSFEEKQKNPKAKKARTTKRRKGGDAAAADKGEAGASFPAEMQNSTIMDEEEDPAEAETEEVVSGAEASEQASPTKSVGEDSLDGEGGATAAEEVVNVLV
jgi:hypothetical protein